MLILDYYENGLFDFSNINKIFIILLLSVYIKVEKNVRYA
jgi:hypothetical protein